MIPNFIKRNKKLWTLNSVKTKTKFDRIEVFDKKEYREWEPKRSKLAAAIVKRMKTWTFKENSVVLYLGVSHGYTVSFLGDICKDGIIYALDFAPRVMRDLVYISEQRNNIIPLLANAKFPEKYSHKVNIADVIYMDVAQKNQAEIFIKNCNTYLKKGGTGYLALKTRSVDVTKKPQMIYKQVRKELEEYFQVLEVVELDPLEKDHAMFVVRKQ